MARKNAKQLDPETARRHVLEVIGHLDHVLGLARSAAGGREPGRAALYLAQGIGDLAGRDMDQLRAAGRAHIRGRLVAATKA